MLGVSITNFDRLKNGFHMVRILTLLLLTGMLSGCAGGLEAGASGAGSDSPARNGFKFDNVLMEQNKLLAYHAFEKYIAVEGVVEKVESVDGRIVLYHVADPESKNIKVWISNFGQKLDARFSVGKTIRVLGDPQKTANFESVAEIVADEYLIRGMCIANLNDGRVAYHRPFRAICDNWEEGRLDQIHRLTSRLK